MLKGFQKTPWAMVALIGLFLFSKGAPASNADIVLLLSSDNAFYQATIDGMKQRSDQPQQFMTIILEANGQPSQSLPESFQYLVTFGSKAASYVTNQGLQTKTIVSYLTREQYLQLATGGFHRVALLDQPLSRYLAFSKALVEGARIGMMTLDERTLALLTEVADSGLQVAQPPAANRLLGSLRDLLDEVDVFLMTPDLSLYNRNSLRGILLTTYRAGKPVVSFSPAHVRSGALGSIFSSPDDIAKHLSDILSEPVQKSQPGIGNIEDARYFSITTNGKVARSLGLDIPGEDTLLNNLREALK